MTTLSPTRSAVRARPTDASVVLRWMVTFVGFPLGAVAARIVAGPTNDALAAALGGLVNGAVLGAVQSWGFGRTGPPALRWVAATAIGLMIGLGIGATAVDFATDVGSLVVQGAVCGVAVGAAQSLVLRRPLGALVFAWPAVLGVVWAAGWAITTAVGVQVDEQFTVFGSAGAVVVTAITVVLPLALRREASA
jgi:hypothetical protein